MSSRVVSRATRERRRDKRRLLPELNVTLGRLGYLTRDWSLGGVLLSGFDGDLNPEDELDGRIGLPSEPESYPFEAVVVRCDAETGQLALNFTELSDGAFKLLEGCTTGRRS